MINNYFFRAFLCLTLFLFSTSLCVSTQAQTVDQTGLFDTQSGNFVFHAELTFTDADNDGVFDASLNLSDRRISAWTDYACVLAFYTEALKVRTASGSFVFTNTFIPTSGEKIDVWFSVNVSAKTYSVSAQKKGGEVILISDAGAFRYQATSIDRWSALHNSSGEPDFVTIHKAGIVNNVGDIYVPQVEPAESFNGYTVTEKGAWCWFADPRALHYENEAGTINSTYIGYIDVHGQLKATQHDFLTGKTNEVSIRTYFQPDDHNNPTFLVLPDERIMIFYSRHTDEACFYYRVSQKPGDITTLGKEVRLATANNTTYPSPFILSNDPDHIYLCWRGINWHPTIAQLSIPDENDACSFTWGPKQIVQSTGARPYAKYFSNGVDKIYMTYTTAHPDNQNPNYIYFNYIDVVNKQLKDINGTFLRNINDGTFSVAATSTYKNAYPATVVDDTNMRNWIWQVTQDAVGNPVIAMVRINDAKTSHDYYYAKWTGTEWRKTLLGNAGGHFHQTATTERCYSGGLAIDDANPNEVYCSMPIVNANTFQEVYEIVKFTLDDNGEVIDTTYITKNSDKNNIRPYVIPGSENSPLRVSWMNGWYYYWIVSSTYQNAYPTSIQSNWQLPTDDVNLTNGLLTYESFEGTIIGTAEVTNGVLVCSKNTSATLAATTANTFSIALSPYLYAGTYGGDILSMGNLIYGVDATTQKPYVKINNTIYNSSNILGSSDVWKTQATGTGGNWPTPTKYTYFGLALTYENGVLRTYINGLIDQSISISGLTLSDVTIGGFVGWVEDCSIYTRALLQDEVRSLSATANAYTLDTDLLGAVGLAEIELPNTIYTDIPLRTKTASGNTVAWATNNAAVLTQTGIVTLPQVQTVVDLTATVGNKSRVFPVTVMPRDIEKNKRLYYQFNPDDLYTADGVSYVKDKSGNENDLAIYGSAQITGVLDLTANTAAGFSTNGHAIAPRGMLHNLRSYTFAMRVLPTSLNNAPRLYDFGSSAYNSVFGRANALTQGVKYNSGTTLMINSTEQLAAGTETTLAFTFDARTATSKIYVDGVEKASGTNITYEPYQVADIAADTRNYIGRTQWWNGTEAANNIDYVGTIDDFYLFDIALTTTEIRNLNVSSDFKSAENTIFAVYPNPAQIGQKLALRTDKLSENTTLEVVDVLGKTIATTKAKTLQAPSQAGLYLVRLLDGVNTEVVRLLVK